jgi:hypothetical protein
MPGFHHDVFILTLAFIVGIVSVARTARLLLFDEFPPVEWLRVRFLALFREDSPWTKLAECQYCVAPYLAAGMVAWAWLSDLHWTWWLINIWWAGSYLAAITVSYDEPA